MRCVIRYSKLPISDFGKKKGLVPSSRISSLARINIVYWWQMLNTYRNTATESERECIVRNLQETEEWLYEDGDDESENAYIEKLNDIRKVTLPISKFCIKASVRW